MLSRRQMLAAGAVAATRGLRPPPARAASPTDIGGLPADARLGKPNDLNGYYPFAVPKTREEWEARRAKLREQLLVATGLWPMPAKTPLDPVIHGAIRKDGYTIEKVYFASLPGHYVTGNLYRPAGTSPAARSPGVLFAHGHWKGGRFEVADDKQAERDLKSKAEGTPESARYFMQALPATLAKLGFVVFQYDMVGYADSTAIPHREGFRDAAAELRLQSAMGLQTWNSVRALDFLTGLPDVDPKRIGMTGASGGGTQTFILAGIDDRIAAAFPAVMVSAVMQGGCVCENGSLLRVGTGNVEVAGLFAPKPMAMSCANDWTKDFLRDGYGLPELKKLYALYGKPELVDAKVWPEYPHNYNQKAREFMYAWFRKHLLGTDGPVAEPPFEPVVPPAKLSVFDADHPRPTHELPAARLRERMAEASDAQIAALTPKDAAGVAEFRRVIGTALRVMLHDELPAEIAVRAGPVESKGDGLTMHRAVLGRKDEKDAVPFAGVFGPKFDGARVAVWVHPQGKASLFDDGTLVPAARALVDAGVAVVAMDVLGVGERAGTPAVNGEYAGYTFGYNRSLLANRVHDVLTGIAFGKHFGKAKSVLLVGWGEFGPAAALAAAAAGGAVARTAADLNRFGFAKVGSTADPMMLPGAVKYGGLPAFLGLAAPAAVFAYRPPAAGLDTARAVYAAAGAAGKLTVADEATPEQVAGWLIG
jgi:dienelactone hydrolase